jgi:hyperosmotically inducible protein
MTARKTLIAAAAVCWAFAAGGAFAGDKTANSDQPVTDTMITTKVKAELAKDSSTKATDINVTTKDGVVMLDGAVSSMAEKEKAEVNAKSVKGVVGVANNLRVAQN